MWIKSFLLVIAICYQTQAAEQNVVIRPITGQDIATNLGAANSNTLRVTLASDSPGTGSSSSTTTIRVITSTFTVQISSNITTIPAIVISSNSNRNGIECSTLCSNTDFLYVKLGDINAQTTDEELPACASWQPPPTVTYTGFIRAIAASGTQTIRCIEY